MIVTCSECERQLSAKDVWKTYRKFGWSFNGKRFFCPEH